MIVLDASVLVAFFSGADAHHVAATELLAAAGAEDLVVSSMTLAELLVGPVREGAVDALLEALARLEVGEELFPEDVAVRLARLRAETGLRMPDCCVLLAAESAGAETVGTFDGRLGQVARGRGLTVVGV
ncbi:type II toxin-antitoxin system VapC family toxin [Mycolicibacterium frederiksbergense]|uniref:Ribonuclease VapC n=1 Tax=Mycolicibacterium frederiksbergense TaxID=117567 RepID=A0A6H0RWY1_9MYCO|nr:type II toxin-antitoxin system VapC family toxin [Mycolicibacterium frederiksbergense]QIV79628.1 type II toxin-antitoxin system VapC family toxin [Mycolicibacterium frederiksbergense]